MSAGRYSLSLFLLCGSRPRWLIPLLYVLWRHRQDSHPASIIVRSDDDGRKALAQFTTEHMGEDIEFMVAGRVLQKARVTSPRLGGVMTFIHIFGAGEIVEVASRIAADGRIEVNAIRRPRQ